MRKVFTPGTVVRVKCVGQDDFDAEIDSVQIRRKDVLYQIAYWGRDGRKTEWIPEDSVSANADTTSQRIGFHA